MNRLIMVSGVDSVELIAMIRPRSPFLCFALMIDEDEREKNNKSTKPVGYA